MRTKTLYTIFAIAVFSFGAFADDGHNGNSNSNSSSFEAGVSGSVPGLGIGGILSGGVPWVVKEGEATVSPNGNIRVQVQGLLIGPGGPANLVGTTGPVTMLGATLVCGGTGGTPVPELGPVSPSPLSASGNAQISQTVMLPPVCFGPVVLVRVFNSSAPLGSQLGAFIAVTGLTANTQNQNHNENDNDGKGGGGQGH
jgi:hypothetical protein